MKSAVEYINSVKEGIEEVTVEQLQSLLSQNEIVLIDVREHEEYIQGHIAGSVNFPRGVLETKLCEHPSVAHHCDTVLALEDIAKQNVYLICRSGGRSALAAHSLKKMGHPKAFSVAGGMAAWESCKLPSVS